MKCPLWFLIVLPGALLLSGCDWLPGICSKSDLIVSGLHLIGSFSKDDAEIVVEAGVPQTFSTTTQNAGTKRAAAHTNRLAALRLVNGQVTTVASVDYPSGALGPQESFTKQNTLQFNQPGTYEVKGIADVFSMICETSNNNNERTISLTAPSASGVAATEGVLRVRVVDTGKADPSLPSVVVY